MHQTYQLSHADAARIVDAIRAELEKQNKGAAIAVADAHGELIAFLRTDGCPLPSVTIAMNKAFTAGRLGKESADVGRKSRDENTPILNHGDIRYLGWGGGVPLVYRGQVVGAVGVSGLPEQEDIVLARMGAALLGE